ncbi:hypothetical protein VNI00_009194 [Paramarasmius palmivorus]|uniref:Uncharacterized protein n=1 Tax=Paramarasmius palmivorus TaxID=297713 RepID=A0AAW0CSP1_9AGAR
MNHDVTIYGPDGGQFRPERFLNEDGTHKPSPPDSKEEGRHLANNALYTFGIALWAMHLESGEAGGTIDTNDVGAGIMSNAPRFTLLTKPRFSEVLDLLKLAKDEWS